MTAPPSHTNILHELYHIDRIEELKPVSSCARVWLALWNSIFTVLGLVFFILGSVLRFKSDLFTTYLSDLMASVYPNSDLSLSDFLYGLSFTLIVLGLVIFVIGAVGCLGACCKLRSCLLMYTVIVLIVLAMQVTGVVLLLTLKSQIAVSLKSALKETLVSSYAGDTGTDVITRGWNFAFIQLDCCGVDNYTDIQSAVHWNRTVSHGGHVLSLQAPISCCKLDGYLPDIVWPANSGCALEPNSTTSNYKNGCYDVFEKLINGYSTTYIVTGVILSLVEILSVVAAVVLFRDLGYKEVALKE